MANFRKYILSSGREIFGGRDAENNDELVRSAAKGDLLLHTDAPGSPFVNVGQEVDKSEIEEAAIFCAKYSQVWRDRKQDVIVNKFFRRDMKKGVFMKAGTWSVKSKENVKVKKADILKFEKEIIEKNG